MSRAPSPLCCRGHYTSYRMYDKFKTCINEKPVDSDQITENIGNITSLNYPSNDISFHFIFTFFRRVTLHQSWFSRGPPLNRKNTYKLKYNPIILAKKTEKVARNLKRKIKWCYASMAFSFTLNAGKVWAVLQSLGSEFQIVAPLYAKLFCPNFVFFLGGLRFKLELRMELIFYS